MKKYKIRQEETVDLWFNAEGHEGELLITYNGDSIEKGYNSYDLKNITNAEKLIDEMLGILGRDIKNWHTFDIVIHWGVHNWKFINNYNISEEGEI